jgi:hypothetical protein
VRPDQSTARWTDVTPLVFIVNTAVGWAAFAAPSLLPNSGPHWAHDVAMLVVLALGAMGWRAYSAGVSARGWRVVILAFCAAASWPIGIFGAVVGGGWMLLPQVLATDQADGGEVVVFLLFIIGGAAAALACWWFSRVMMRTIWPKPRVASGPPNNELQQSHG